MNDSASQTARPAVLVVDDDLHTRECLDRALTSLGIEVTLTCSWEDAQRLSNRRHFDLLVVELCLPDLQGTELIRALVAQETTAPFIVVSRCLTVPMAVEAVRYGAVDVIEKPFKIDDVIDRVGVALRQVAFNGAAGKVLSQRSDPYWSESIGERWAKHVLRASELSTDPKTLRHWARALGVSYSTLCESCRLVGVKPHLARDFARMLRATRLAFGHQCPPEVFLDVSDRRTLNALLERAGISPINGGGYQSLESFLDNQRFVAQDCSGLACLRRALRRN